MPSPIRTLLRLMNEFLGQCYLAAAFWIVIASYLILSAHLPAFPALELTISSFLSIYILSFLGLIPILGQVIYLAIAQPVVTFLSGGSNNSLLAASWKLPMGLEQILGPLSGILPAEGTAFAFLIEAGFWLSAALSLQILFQGITRWLIRIRPPAPKPPADSSPSGIGFFERCQVANDAVLFPLMGLAFLGSVAFATSHQPIWEGITFCGAAVLAALVCNLIFSIIRIPPGSGFVVYALAMPGILTMILSGAQDFSPPVFTLPWTVSASGIAPSITLIDYAVAAGWSWMVYLLLHRTLGFLQWSFPRVWVKPRPVEKASKPGGFAVWKNRLATLIVVLLSLAGIAVLIWSVIFGEDYRHPVIYSFGDLKGTMVCIENCAPSGGQWALLPDNLPPGTPRTMVVRLEAAPGPPFLRIEPRRQPGLTFIDLSIGVQWIDPSGKTVAELDPEERFPGSELSQYWFYRKDILIPALVSGNYTLVVTPYDDGIAWITVTIRKNP
jgi:hypothetical protein